MQRSRAAVLASGEDEDFSKAVRSALTDVLGEADAEKVYARAVGDRADAPASQLDLMWLSAHMPRAATRVPAAARDHYAAAA